MSTATTRSKYTIKLVIIGPTGVGKTSLRGQYISGRFSAAYRATIGADFIAKTLPHPSKPDQNVILQIWDTAGQERFSNLSKAFYRGADAVIMVFDVHQPESLDALSKSWAEFREGAPLAEENLPEYPCFVVGNKVDLTGDAISEESIVGRKQAEEFIAGLITTAAPSLVSADSSEVNHGATSSININAHVSSIDGLGAARRSRNSPSQPVSRPGTVSSINTTMSNYHTPSSSLFPEIYHTARSSLGSWSADTSRDSTPVIKQRRITILPNESTSGESAVTITPGLFARRRSAGGSQETTLTTPEDGILEPNTLPPVPPPPERGPSLHFTSARTGQGVRELFEHVAARVMQKVEYEEYVEARQMHYREASGTETIRLGPDGQADGQGRKSLGDLTMSACCS